MRIIERKRKEILEELKVEKTSGDQDRSFFQAQSKDLLYLMMKASEYSENDVPCKLTISRYRHGHRHSRERPYE